MKSVFYYYCNFEFDTNAGLVCHCSNPIFAMDTFLPRQIIDGEVNSEVAIEIPGGQTIVSIITEDSVESLELSVGKQVCAVVKASNGMVAVN